jgi:hypothetical protein
MCSNTLLLAHLEQFIMKSQDKRSRGTQQHASDKHERDFEPMTEKRRREIISKGCHRAQEIDYDTSHEDSHNRGEVSQNDGHDPSEENACKTNQPSQGGDR